MNVLSIIEEAVQDVKRALSEDWIPVTHELCEEMGLDPRARTGKMYYSRDGIAVIGRTQPLDYYGGFEYVDGVCRLEIGDVTIYSMDDDRVRRHVLRVLEEDEADAIREEYGDEEYAD